MLPLRRVYLILRAATSVTGKAAETNFSSCYVDYLDPKS